MKTRKTSDLQDEDTSGRHLLSLRLALLTTVLALAAMGACRGSDIIVGGEDPDPCQSIFVEPLINITSVVDQVSGEPIETVFLDSIVIRLEPLRNFAALVGPDSIDYGVTATPENLVCDVPCGFAVFEGDWQLRISAHGYAPRKLALGDIYYSNVTDTCPLRHRGAFHFETDLQPVN